MASGFADRRRRANPSRWPSRTSQLDVGSYRAFVHTQGFMAPAPFSWHLEEKGGVRAIARGDARSETAARQAAAAALRKVLAHGTPKFKRERMKRPDHSAPGWARRRSRRLRSATLRSNPRVRGLIDPSRYGIEPFHEVVIADERGQVVFRGAYKEGLAQYFVAPSSSQATRRVLVAILENLSGGYRYRVWNASKGPTVAIQSTSRFDKVPIEGMGPNAHRSVWAPVEARPGQTIRRLAGTRVGPV